MCRIRICAVSKPTHFFADYMTMNMYNQRQKTEKQASGGRQQPQETRLLNAVSFRGADIIPAASNPSKILVNVSRLTNGVGGHDIREKCKSKKKMKKGRKKENS